MIVKLQTTAEELWEMPEKPGVRYELVGGELIELAGAGALHNLIVGVLYKLLDAFVQSGDLGLTFTDNTGYILRRGPDVVRIPDLSFVSWERVPTDGVPEGYMPVAPDLAVEIVSPNDRADDVHDKVREYQQAGVRLVWILWPKHGSATVHEHGVIARELGPDDVLDGGDVLLGLRLRVGALFEVRRSR